MTVDDGRWTFGLAPLPQTVELAALLRQVAGLAMAVDDEDPAVEKLIDDLRAASHALETRVAPDAGPRVGPDAGPHQRPYLDHARDIGAYNPCFPEYDITVNGPRASGRVTFPLAFEGPPGVVHGGVLATFFDCVIQHHNCDVGVAGKTVSLLVEYRRPTPVGVELSFGIDRVTDGRRITSTARLERDGSLLCAATMAAVAGDRARLPAVLPRVER